MHPIDLAVKPQGNVLMTSDQIEFHGIAVDFVKARDQVIEDALAIHFSTRRTLRERRDVAAEEIAQETILRRP